MKKFFVFLSVFLVAVLSISLCVHSFNAGYGKALSDDGYTGIGLPKEGFVLYDKAAPMDQLIEPDEDLLLENTETSSNIYASGVISGVCYATSFVRTNISSYDYFKLEFDLENCTEDKILSCDFHLIFNEGSNRPLIPQTWFTISGDTLGVSKASQIFTLCDNYGKFVTGEKFHIEYVCKYNEQNSKKSRMQIFVNGELFSDTVLIGKDLSSKDFKSVCELRFRYFNTEDKLAGISVSNLKLTGYHELDSSLPLE